MRMNASASFLQRCEWTPLHHVGPGKFQPCQGRGCGLCCAVAQFALNGFAGGSYFARPQLGQKFLFAKAATSSQHWHCGQIKRQTDCTSFK